MVCFTYFTANWASRGKLYDNPENLPPARVGLVFGTSDSFRGRENRYFRYRVEAAAKLWKTGKVKTLIVSGDNRTKYYNEPKMMKEALVNRGVPAERIVCDYAGLRTLDSVVRAKKIFGLGEVVFISQRFQNERAIYLARANGLRATGFNARDVGMRAGFRTRVREIGARVKMWMDIHLLDTRPRHLGEKEILPE